MSKRNGGWGGKIKCCIKKKEDEEKKERNYEGEGEER